MSEENLDSMFQRIQGVYLPEIIELVKLRADAIAKTKGHATVAPEGVLQAFKDYMPGEILTATKPKWTWMNQNVTGFMVVSGGLAIICGVLAAILSSRAPEQAKDFTEIVKVLVGALIGGAAGAATAAAGPSRKP